MKLSEFKNYLESLDEIKFQFADGSLVPRHFHITEIGQVEKKYIDCGGTIREEKFISLQLWESIDIWHRLDPKKLIRIIDLSISQLGIEDHSIEVEYQNQTIGKYNLGYSQGIFTLLPTQTACLAIDSCVVPIAKIQRKLSEFIPITSNCCTPETGCC